jgi:hypothetical protein
MISASFKVRIARSVISSRLPIGVATMYRVPGMEGISTTNTLDNLISICAALEGEEFTRLS